MPRNAVKNFRSSLDLTGAGYLIEETVAVNVGSMFLIRFTPRRTNATNWFFARYLSAPSSGDSLRGNINSSGKINIFWEYVGGGLINLTTTNFVKYDQENTFVLMATGTKIVLWLNGVVTNGSNYSGTIKPATGMIFGKNYSTNYFQGFLHEVAFWESAEMTAFQIATMNTSFTFPVTPTFTTDFREGFGTTLADLSGNGKTLTLVGTVNFVPYVISRRRSEIGDTIIDDQMFVMTGQTGLWFCYNDTLYRRNPSNYKQLQKSTNNGITWTNLASFTYNLGNIVVCENGNILVAQHSTVDYWENPPFWWELSTDGGTTFATVLTYASGGVASWSFDVRGNTIFVGEYGIYNSVNIYRSTDGGANWTTVFTHPNDSATIHIHKIHIDKNDPNLVFISYGDGTDAKGISMSTNGGDNWTEICSTEQPTWIETDDDYVYFGEDLEGLIHRAPKAALLVGDYTLTVVYDAQTDTRGEFAKLSFYSGMRDNFGNIYFGGVAYGENNPGGNNKDAVCVVTPDQGATWHILKISLRNPDSSCGISVMSKPHSSGRIYMMHNNSNIGYFLYSQLVDRYIKTSGRTNASTRTAISTPRTKVT